MERYFDSLVWPNLFELDTDGENTTPKSVYEVLDRTAFHLRRGELLDAVSTLNTLEGTKSK